MFLFALRAFYKNEINLESRLHIISFLCYQTEDIWYLSKQFFLCSNIHLFNVFWEYVTKKKWINSVNQMLLLYSSSYHRMTVLDVFIEQKKMVQFQPKIAPSCPIWSGSRGPIKIWICSLVRPLSLMTASKSFGHNSLQLSLESKVLIDLNSIQI